MPLVCPLPCQQARGGSRPLVASLDSSRRRPGDLVVVRRFPTAGVTLLLCVLLAVAAPPKSRVGSSRVIDAEPQIRCLIFQPMVGRLHSSMLCAVAAWDGEEFLSHQAGWSCRHDESPRLGGGRLEWCAWKLPRPTEGDHGLTSSAQGRYPGAGAGGELLG